MGHTLTSSVSWALLPIPHLCLDYTTFFVACQDLFLIFFGPPPWMLSGILTRYLCSIGTVRPNLSEPSALALCAFIIAHLLGNVKYFFNFFSGFSVPKQSRSSESYSAMSSPENISQSSWNSLRSPQVKDAPLRISQIPASPSRYQMASAVSALTSHARLISATCSAQ